MNDNSNVDSVGTEVGGRGVGGGEWGGADRDR